MRASVAIRVMNINTLGIVLYVPGPDPKKMIFFWLLQKEAKTFRKIWCKTTQLKKRLLGSKVDLFAFNAFLLGISDFGPRTLYRHNKTGRSRN